MAWTFTVRNHWPVLLKELVKVIKNIEWIRLLYAFPSHVTDELIEVIAQEPKICKYIDMPLQHISDHILLEQNRNITTQQTIDLIQKIRTAMPQGFVRTTFITGLPGETEEDFEQMRGFVKDFRFERVGVFVYSKEEGTAGRRNAGAGAGKDQEIPPGYPDAGPAEHFRRDPAVFCGAHP